MRGSVTNLLMKKVNMLPLLLALAANSTWPSTCNDMLLNMCEREGGLGTSLLFCKVMYMHSVYAAP